MIVDIVMIVYSKSNRLIEMTKKAISSLHESETDHSFNLILLESGDYEDGRYENCTYIKPNLEFNYHRFMNFGLKYCTNEFVGLANNDLVFHKNWFSNILEYANGELKDVKSFSAWNSHGNWHNNHITDMKDYYVEYGVGVYLTGWFLLLKREILDTITLKEDVNFWFSDNTYQDELIKYHIKHALIRNSVVDHITSATLFTHDGPTIVSLTHGQQENYNSTLG